MRFSYDWIGEYVDLKGISAEEAAEKLTMHSFEVEEVLKEGSDHVFHIDILPNRIPDASSHIGVAREVALLYSKTFTPPNPQIQEDEHITADAEASVSITDTDRASRYSARVLSDVRVEESPSWLKERLELLGLQSVNNVVDAANYVMLEYGQPLHAFDLDAISGAVQVRAAKKGETITTLDGNTLELTSDDTVISDEKQILALAGVKGGVSSGVTEKTTRVLLESATFERVFVRNTARRLGVHTDASTRFSAGLSPANTVRALNRLAELIIKTSGGRVASGVLDEYPSPPPARAVAFEHEEVEQFLGTSVSYEEVERILTGLGCQVHTEERKIQVRLPEARPDLERAEDVFEEIGRITGYDKIASVPLRSELHPARPDEHRAFRETVEDTLSALGFWQVQTYNFVSEDDKALEAHTHDDRWELVNPISTERQFLRRSLIPEFIRVIQRNQRFSESFGVYEVGKVYTKQDESPHERWSVGIARAEARAEGAENLFLLFKGTIETLCEKLGILEIWFDDVISKDDPLPPGFHPTRSAIVYTEGNTKLGVFGELHPAVADEHSISGRVHMALFDCGALREEALVDTLYKEIPKYPPVKRDIAFLVSEETRIADIENVLYNAGAEHLIDVDLFDMYEETGEEGKKSVAFHLIFQSDERTLESVDVEAEEKRIKEALIKKLGAEIR